ncbi:MAG: hypothetical protein ACREQ4_12540 [Candidatus Binataceae bacterium]
MKKINVGGVTIYEPNGDSPEDFIRCLVDDANAKGLHEVNIGGITHPADRAKVETICEEKGIKVRFEGDN